MTRLRTPLLRSAAFLLAFAVPWIARAQSERSLIGASQSDGSRAGSQRAGLQSADIARSSAAIDALAERRDRGSVAQLANFIAEGQPDALTDRALSALGRIGSPEALPILTQLTHHRRTSARERSYAAIAQIPDPRAEALLGQGLRDSDSSVRTVCARGLGERRAKSQLDLLFRAFSRGVPEAAPAIGRIADKASLLRLHGYLGHAPLQPMLNAYEVLLLRADIDEASKLDIIARLGEVATPSVRHFMEALMASHNWSGQLGVLRAMADTAKRIQPSAPAAEKKP